MFPRLRQALVMLAAAGDRKVAKDLGRKAAVLGARLLRDPESVRERLEGFEAVARLHAEETGSWVSPEAVGKGGPFDACDLRCWLELARIAGVPAVPATEVLALEEHEMALLSGKVEMPDTAPARFARSRAGLLEEALGGAQFDPDPETDLDELHERLYAAMDGVPEGWMVRYARCGSSELKALAGAGAAGPAAPEVRFGPDLEVGPGWVRNGNRRRVHVSDARTVESAAQGPGGKAVFLARPWVEAARFVVGEDPHRHGTMFAGKGAWPAEWRAFVEGGRVRGVSFYYGWCGQATPEDARIALEVRDLAQRVADTASAARAWPRYMDVEFVRFSGNEKLLSDPRVSDALEALGRESVACTLDFIETAEGLMLLEGGPANTPFGGGHPCAFAGCGGQPRFGNRTLVDGVAFRSMPHVLIGDPSTWTEGDREGCILTWEEAEALALPTMRP